jgi:hypothetical protein
MSAEFIDRVPDEHKKGKAFALDLVEEIKASFDWVFIFCNFETQEAYDGNGDDVDLVFEPVSMDRLGLFGNFVRIDGEIRLATDFSLHFGTLCFSAYEVSQEVADSVEENIASYSRPARKES